MSPGQCCTERVIICQLDSVALRVIMCQLDSIALKELLHVSWTVLH